MHTHQLRKPFQGVGNILRFNRHFYLPAAFGTIALGAACNLLPGAAGQTAGVLLALVAMPTALSLAAAAWIYDLSGLYWFDWLHAFDLPPCGHFVNIHAGFDESSAALQARFPDARLTVFDFFDPAQHTERSILQARRAYPAYPGTVAVKTNAILLPDQSTAVVFLLFAAHEIRNDNERAAFFRELARILQPGGKIIMAEHLRDIPNFTIWNLGAFHFLSRATWLRTFDEAGLSITGRRKHTPFIHLFELQTRHGNPS